MGWCLLPQYNYPEGGRALPAELKGESATDQDYPSPPQNLINKEGPFNIAPVIGLLDPLTMSLPNVQGPCTLYITCARIKDPLHKNLYFCY